MALNAGTKHHKVDEMGPGHTERTNQLISGNNLLSKLKTTMSLVYNNVSEHITIILCIHYVAKIMRCYIHVLARIPALCIQ